MRDVVRDVGDDRGRKVWAGEMCQGAFRGPEVVW